LRRARVAEPGTISGPVRLDRRTKRLVGRLRPGDIAVIDHVDIDRVAADSLVAVGVSAVLNAKPSISGRYPNLGPEALMDAGIALVDDLGEDLFRALHEGVHVRVEGNAVFVGDEKIASGLRHDSASIHAAMAEAREGLSVQLEAFAANTMEFLKQEKELLLDGIGVPDVTTKIAGKHALIVVRGYDYKADLEVLRPYIREFKPVLIGVDGGADALVEAGFAKSKAEARRTVEQGGAYVNNRRVEGLATQLKSSELASESVMVLRSGKKKYALLRFRD